MTRTSRRRRQHAPPDLRRLSKAFSLGAVCFALTALALSASADDGSVQVELAPYVWLAGIDGDVSAGGRSASFDESFSDLIHEVDAGAMVMGSLRYKRLVIFGQFDYIELSADADLTADIRPDPLPIGIELDGDVDTTIATGGIGRSGTGVLKVDGKAVATQKMERTLPLILQWDENLDVGSDTGTLVADSDYQVPFAFTGKIEKITLKIDRPQLSPKHIEQLKAAQRNNRASE